MRLSISSHPPFIHPAGDVTRALARLVVAILLLAPVTGRSQSLTPPAAPEVAPLISEAYASDSDGDHIEDALGQHIETATASVSGNKRRGVSAIEAAPIDVELIFRTPVTQQQIDAFLAAGGRITYLYKALSYGWKGQIAAANIGALPVLMGPSLVLVERTHKIVPYMDVAGQVGRVRPIWQPGFAGMAAGFDGDPSITIGFVVDGVDETHPDLTGRCAYWSDLSEEHLPVPVDFFGHGSMGAGVAVGTGFAGTQDFPALRYTHVGDWYSLSHVVNPITFDSSVYVDVDSAASFVGAGAILAQIRWIKGGGFDDLDWIGQFDVGGSDLHVSNTYLATTKQVFAVMLAAEDSRGMEEVVIRNTVSLYLGPDDGFPRFRGVAPDCRWAAARLGYPVAQDDQIDGIGQSLDDLVANREAHNIKIINISYGLDDDEGFPDESQTLRDKVNSAVRNGVVVVSAAGNSGSAPYEAFRKMADPPRAALAITVGASNDENALTSYSTHGYLDPDHEAGEDYKPDLIAPGGSIGHSAIMSVDSGCNDGLNSVDRQPDDYTNSMGTSFSSPFVAGCAALVIDAMQQQGVVWDFHSDEQPRFIKMLLCATATETNARCEGTLFSPTLERGDAGPEGYPLGKDRHEGYGVINADAAVEAVCLTYAPRTVASEVFGAEPNARRAWARSIKLNGDCQIDVMLDNPREGDFDVYLYSATPSDTGTPILLASGANTSVGADEWLRYTPPADMEALLVVKRISGSGRFEIRSELAGPPTATDVAVTSAHDAPATLTLGGVDDGTPNPPGQLSYTIVSLPQHGELEHVGTGQPIATVPVALGAGVEQVVYRPDAGWTGQDSFTYLADDGGTAPFGGRSNVGTVALTIVPEITVTYAVSAPNDDAHARRWSTLQKLNELALIVGQHRAGMRFTGIDIPPGARIVRAKLRICSFVSDLKGAVDTVIYAEAADDVAAFGSGHRLSDVTTTNASQAWDWNAAWSSNTWYESPDIAHVIQEVVDRPGWSPNSSIAILCIAGNDTNVDRSFWAYDGDSDKAARLEITYVP